MYDPGWVLRGRTFPHWSVPTPERGFGPAVLWQSHMLLAHRRSV